MWGKEGWEVRTRMQMLQLHSWMSPLYEERGPEVFNARVTAPQWQLPVYILGFSREATGSGPVYLGGM
jgi:hypothetical protein